MYAIGQLMDFSENADCCISSKQLLYLLSLGTLLVVMTSNVQNINKRSANHRRCQNLTNRPKYMTTHPSNCQGII